MEKGILYVATAEKFIEQAKRSAKRVKKHTDVPIAFVSHRKVSEEIFDFVIVDENPKEGYIDKPRNIPKTPFSKTLYLDTDAYLIEEIPELWQLLEKYDLCAAIDANEGALRYSDKTDSPTRELPEAFPEYNTGVIGFTNNAQDFLEKWLKNHEESYISDQSSFRETLFSEDIRFTPLSNNYNCFMSHPTQVCGEVKIVHDFFMEADESIEGDVGEVINRSSEPRILYFNTGQIYSVLDRGGERLLEKLAVSIHKVTVMKNYILDKIRASE